MCSSHGQQGVANGSFLAHPHTARNELRDFPARYRQATLLTAQVVAGGSSLAISHTGRNDPEKPPVAGGGRSRRHGCRAGVVGGGGRPESLSMRGSCKFLYRVYGRGNDPCASDPATWRGGNGGNGGKHPAQPLLVRLRISPLCRCVAPKWGKFPPDRSKMRREISPRFPRADACTPSFWRARGRPPPLLLGRRCWLLSHPRSRAGWKSASDGRRQVFPTWGRKAHPRCT